MDLHNLTQSSSAVAALEEVVLLVLVTVQSLAVVPSLRQAIERWKTEFSGLEASGDLQGMGLAVENKPWEGFNW